MAFDKPTTRKDPLMTTPGLGSTVLNVEIRVLRVLRFRAYGYSNNWRCEVWDSRGDSPGFRIYVQGFRIQSTRVFSQPRAGIHLVDVCSSNHELPLTCYTCFQPITSRHSIGAVGTVGGGLFLAVAVRRSHCLDLGA